MGESNSMVMLIVFIAAVMVMAENVKETANDAAKDKIAAASSVLASKNGQYKPENAFDGDYTTAWVEGAEGNGIGEWVQVNVGRGNEFGTISELIIEIANGYQKTDKTYEENCIPVKVKCDLLAGTELIKTQNILLPAEKVPEKPDDNGAKVSCTSGKLYFKDLPETNEQYAVRITILDVKKGTKNADAAITEIRTTFKDANPHRFGAFLYQLCDAIRCHEEKLENCDNAQNEEFVKLKNGRVYTGGFLDMRCREMAIDNKRIFYVRSTRIVDVFNESDCDGEDGWFQRFYWNGKKWVYKGVVTFMSCDGC